MDPRRLMDGIESQPDEKYTLRSTAAAACSPIPRGAGLDARLAPLHVNCAAPPRRAAPTPPDADPDRS